MIDCVQNKIYMSSRYVVESIALWKTWTTWRAAIDFTSGSGIVVARVEFQQSPLTQSPLPIFPNGHVALCDLFG
jgi:hypothetical protein